MLNSVKSYRNIYELSELLQSYQYKLDDSGAKMLVSQSNRIPHNPIIERAINEICVAKNSPYLFSMCNILDPGVSVPIHTDTLVTVGGVAAPKLERWHLVVRADKSLYWDEVNGDHTFWQGWWYGPIPYWIKHRVWNPGKIPRIHLIIDLEKFYVPPILSS